MTLKNKNYYPMDDLRRASFRFKKRKTKIQIVLSNKKLINAVYDKQTNAIEVIKSFYHHDFIIWRLK